MVKVGVGLRAGWLKQLILSGFLVLALMAGGSSAGEPVAGCEPVSYRLLPGEFNYCLGRKLWESGRHQRAVEMLEMAASWGSKPAERLLGVAYFNGEGIAKNRALGLAWLHLAAERNDRYSRQLYQSALRAATEAEQRRMREELTALNPRYSDAVAVSRAARRFKRELGKLRSNPAYGSGMCMLGLNATASSFAVPASDVENPPSACSLYSEQVVIDAVMVRYQQYFHGLRDAEVIVGPLQKVPRAQD